MGGGYRDPNAEFRRALVRQRDHALGAAGERDGVFKSSLAGRIEGGIDSVDDAADVGEQVVAVEDWRGSELRRERLVSRADGSDDLEPLANRQLRGDDPHRPARAEDEQRLALGPAELTERSDRRLDRGRQRAGVVPGHLWRLGSPGGGECVLAVAAEGWQPRGHLVSDRYVAHLAADGVDGSGGLEPEDRGLRQREDPVQVAAADLQIRGTNA